MATPTLIVTRIASAVADRRVADDVAQGLGQLHRGSAVLFGMITANSSPPSLPSSDVRLQPGRDGAGDSRITRSPTAWPRRSLMSLKLSMSTSSSAAPPACAAHSASHPVIRRRLAIPVSGSWSARNASSWRARWASVTSRAGAEHPRRHPGGVGEHLAEAFEDPLGAPVTHHHAVGVAERLQRAEGGRQGLLDHRDVIRMQQRPVLRVVERGAPGDPEKVEQALRPERRRRRARSTATCRWRSSSPAWRAATGGEGASDWASLP